MTGWFRVWEDMADDPKWGAIGKATRVPAGLVLALALKLLTRASTSEERGSVAGYNVEALAYGLGCKAAKVEAMIAGMEAMGVIADGRFAAWDKRQPKREDNSAERVRAHRERAKAAAEAVTQRNAPEAEADTDKKAAAPRASEPLAVGEDVAIEAAAAAVKVDFEKGKPDRGRRSAVTAEAVDLHRWICERTGAPNGYRSDLGTVIGWLDAGNDGEADIKPAIEAVLAREHGQLPNSLRYFEGAIADARRRRGSGAKATLRAGAPPGRVIDWRTASPADWRKKLGFWARQVAKHGADQANWPDFARWRSDDPMGPPPGEAGCHAPQDLVDEALAVAGVRHRETGAAAARMASGGRAG